MSPARLQSIRAARAAAGANASAPIAKSNFGREAPLATAGVRMHTPGVPKTYSREEADEILRRALSQQSADGIDHDDLVAAAREVGIPEAAVLHAANQLGEFRQVKTRVELIRKQKRRAFARHLLTFIIVNGGIFAFDYMDGGPWFFQYVLILWGIVLLLLGIRQLAPDEARLVRRAERELEKDRRRQERQRRRTQPSGRPRVPAAAKEFEAAVQDGVSTLMSAAARAIRDFTPGPRPHFRADDAAEGEERGSERGDAEQRRHRRA
jgi:2TM domain-containing protein